MRVSALSALTLLAVSSNAYATGKMTLDDSPVDCELRTARDTLVKKVHMPTYVVDSVKCTALEAMDTDIPPAEPNKMLLGRKAYREAKKEYDRQKRAQKKASRKGLLAP